MSDTADLVKNIVTGLLAGGASAGTAFFATQGNLKKRLDAVEAQIGSVDENDRGKKTGLYLSVANLEELVRRLRKDFDEFEESPPNWVTRLMTRSRTVSGLNLEMAEALEDKIRALTDRVRRIEEGRDSHYVSRPEYETDDRERAKEVAKLREEMTATNGMIRGMIAMMGIELPEKRAPRP